MGVKNASSHIKAASQQKALSNVISPETVLILDCNSVFYNLLVHACPPETFWRKVNEILVHYEANPKIFVFDGHRSIAKAEEHARRDGLKFNAIESFQNLLNDSMNIRKVSKSRWTKARNLAKKCSSVSDDRLNSIVEHASNLGFQAWRATTEGEFACIKMQKFLGNQGFRSIVISTDSDICFYSELTEGFQLKRTVPEFIGCYVSPSILASHFKIREIDLPLVAAFSGNDYQPNIKGIGIQKMVKTLQKLEVVNRTVAGVLRHFNYTEPNNFSTAYSIFSGQESLIVEGPLLDFQHVSSALMHCLEDIRKSKKTNQKSARPKNWNFFIERNVPLVMEIKACITTENSGKEALYKVTSQQRTDLAKSLERTRQFIYQKRLLELNLVQAKDPKETPRFNRKEAALMSRTERNPDAKPMNRSEATADKKENQKHYPSISLNVGQLYTNLHLCNSNEVASALAETLQIYVKYFHKAKVMAQLAANTFIRDRVANEAYEDSSLIFMTHIKPQTYWQTLLLMCINGGPRPAAGGHEGDFSLHDCQRFELGELQLSSTLQETKMAASRTFYSLFSNQQLEPMPILRRGAVGHIATQLALEMQKDFANHTIGLLPKLKAKCKSLGTTSFEEKKVKGICNFLLYNSSLPQRLQWNYCPISTFRESFLTFTERDLLTIVSKLSSIEDQNRNSISLGPEILKSFMTSEGIETTSSRSFSVRSIENYLKHSRNSCKFLQFILFNPFMHKKGYAKSIRNGRIQMLNSFQTDGFGLYINGLNKSIDYRFDGKFEKEQRSYSALDKDQSNESSDAYFESLFRHSLEPEVVKDELNGRQYKFPATSNEPGVQVVHNSVYAHFHKFTHTKDTIVHSRNWSKFQKSYTDILDRKYMGIDLGENLTYSAVVMNPGGDKPTEIISHERSQGYLVEPLKKFQRWLNHSKSNAILASERAMTGADSSDLDTFRDYAIRRLTSNEAEHLSTFYNRLIFKYRVWQMKLALKQVMDKSIQELFLMLGCDSRSKWDFNNGISPVMGIGLGKFRYHQDSVHAKFAKYLTQKARAIGIIVVGIDEYYTSKKCPCCGHFLFDVIGKKRVKYCEQCNKFFNRDNAAAENICILTILKANSKSRPAHLMEPRFTDEELGIDNSGDDPGGGNNSRRSTNTRIGTGLANAQSNSTESLVQTEAVSEPQQTSAPVEIEPTVKIATANHIPACSGTRTRREIRDYSDKERTEILGAMKLVLSTSANDLISIHGAGNSGYWFIVHASPFFLPWHRLYLRELEDRVSKVLGRPVGLPYWDWTLDSQNPAKSIIFTNDYLGFSSAQTNYIVSDSVFSAKNFRLTYPTSHSLTRTLQLGSLETFAQINQRLKWSDSFSKMSRYVEYNPHARIHVGVGGDMKSSTSPNDPIFWLHHAFVDKIWSKWQRMGDNFDKFDGSAYGSNYMHLTPNSKIPRYGIPVKDIFDNQALCVQYENPGPRAISQRADTLQDLQDIKEPDPIPEEWFDKINANKTSIEQEEQENQKAFEDVKNLPTEELFNPKQSELRNQGSWATLIKPNVILAAMAIFLINY